MQSRLWSFPHDILYRSPNFSWRNHAFKIIFSIKIANCVCRWNAMVITFNHVHHRIVIILITPLKNMWNLRSFGSTRIYSSTHNHNDPTNVLKLPPKGKTLLWKNRNLMFIFLLRRAQKPSWFVRSQYIIDDDDADGKEKKRLTIFFTCLDVNPFSLHICLYWAPYSCLVFIFNALINSPEPFTSS